MDDMGLSNSIIDDSINVTSDLAEFAIDCFFKNGTVYENIPIIKDIYSVFKIGSTIRDMLFVKKTAVFLQECKNKDENYEKRQKIKNKFINDDKYRKNVTETTIAYLDKIDNSRKARLIAKAFIALCDEIITYEEYEFYAKIIDSFTSFDEVNVLTLLERSITPSSEKNELIILGTIFMLKKFGLVVSDQIRGNPIKSELNSEYSFSESGRKFGNIIAGSSSTPL